MSELQDRQMGTEPEGKLLYKMAVPIALAMLVQALYNIIDSAFVGQISEEALSAVSLVFPFQSLFAALNVGIGVGMSQLISLNRGSGHPERARQAAGQGFLLSAVCGVCFLIYGLFFSESFFRLSGINGTVAEMGNEYLQIVTIFSMGLFCEFVLERMLMATGHTGCTMVSQILGAVLNIILDPVFIWGLGGIPAMGVKGAAIATVLAQHVSAVLAWLLHRKKNQTLHFGWNDIRPDRQMLWNIVSVGASATVKQGAGAVVLMFVNGILIHFSIVATAVYGAFNRLYVLFMTPGWAIQDVLVILIAYNLGIKNKTRIRRFFKTGLCSVLGITVLGCMLLFLLPGPLLKIFGAKEEMLSLGTAALPLLACFLPFQSVASAVSAMLQGLGEGGIALTAGVIERFLFPMLLVYLASLSGNLNLVWLSFSVAECIGMLISLAFMYVTYRKKVSVLPE